MLLRAFKYAVVVLYCTLLCTVRSWSRSTRWLLLFPTTETEDGAMMDDDDGDDDAMTTNEKMHVAGNRTMARITLGEPM